MIPTPTDHPLPRDGTSQGQRHLQSLQPSSAPIDDRGLAELLVFAHRYSSLISYHNYENEADGNWQPFFDQFPIIQLSLISVNNSSVSKQSYKTSSNAFQQAITDQGRSQALQDLVALAISELKGIDHWATSFEKNPFYDEIEKTVSNTIIVELLSVIRAGKALFQAAAPPIFSLLSDLKAEFWQIDLASISPSGPSNDPEHLRDELSELFDVIFKARAYLALQAKKSIESTNTETGEHTPHIGLTLAFLKLFEIAQDYLNDLTRKHLENYYRNRLGIENKEAEPDQTFIVFELAKRISSETLAKGTLLNAGKDESKAPIQFTLDREISLNAASVDSLKSLFRDTQNHDEIKSASVANSSDGEGTDLDEANPTWPLFGESSLPAGRVGFAISSRALKTTGGLKTVTVTINLPDDSVSSIQEALAATGRPYNGNIASLFGIRLTGIEEWIEIENFSATFNSTTKSIILALDSLDATTAIVPFDPNLHGNEYNTQNPILEILARSDSTTNGYNILKGTLFDSIHLDVHVTNDRLLIAANDLGPVDVSKPFLPFGPKPTSAVKHSSDANKSSSGSSFYIGSHEILSKKLQSLSLNFDWKDRPADLAAYYSDYPSASSNSFKAKLASLDKANWKPLGGSPSTLLNKTISLSTAQITSLPRNKDLPPFDQLALNSEGGFLQLALVEPYWGFGHKLYPKLLTEKIIAAVKAKTAYVAPNEPYTPTLSSLSATYLARSIYHPGNALDTGDIQLLQIEPHGTYQPSEQKLIPVIPYAAAFYIGLSNLSPKQTITLLFELADGSGNPFLDYPQLEWSYLAGEQWQPFETREIISEGTNELRSTGVIAFSIPPQASLQHTRMPSGKIWIRATISKNANTVNRALQIHAQSCAATFVDNGNDLSRLALPLPADTIAKLVKVNSRVKSINQPIASVGGKSAETGSSYYRRVSERLRHKDRAIQIWDYEHLILQAFPDIFKAKCIPHTAKVTSTGSTTDVTSELSPGDVLIVLVPNLQNRNAFDPLQPAVSQDTLAKVEAFAKKRASHFARIKTVNPRYEEIEAIGDVYIHSEYDTGAYQSILENDVTQFLTPWAYASDLEIVFGKSLHSSQILNFIEELPYVDYIENFKVRQYVNGSAITTTSGDLIPTAEHSILVSKKIHQLSVLKETTSLATL